MQVIVERTRDEHWEPEEDMMKKIMLTLFVVSSAVAVLEPVGHAEPTSTIKYLMAEPVSMLDYGIQKVNEDLQNHANALKVEGESPILKARYSWESNKIQIEIKYFFDSPGSQTNKLSENTVKANIEKAVRYIKSRFLLVSPDTGAPTVMFKEDVPFSRYFEHEGYKNPLQPERLGFKLIQNTEVDVSFVQVNSRGSTVITGKCDALSTMENISWSNR
jgi:hypothetical protein